MIYLLLALLGFAAMGVLHKLGDRMGGHPVRITAALFVFSFVGAIVRAATGPSGLTGSPSELKAAALAAPFGLAAAAAVWTFQAGVRHGRIATSWLLLNLSVAIPTGLSIVLFGESVSLKKATALALIAASMALMWWDRRGQPSVIAPVDEAAMTATGKEG